MFAAYYPDCHSVFGFHDDFPDRSENLSYVVVGWYSQPELDPLREFTLDELKWKLASGGGSIGFDRSFYYGCVLNIDWDPLKAGGYIHPPAMKKNRETP